MVTITTVQYLWLRFDYRTDV